MQKNCKKIPHIKLPVESFTAMSVNYFYLSFLFLYLKFMLCEYIFKNNIYTFSYIASSTFFSIINLVAYLNYQYFSFKIFFSLQAKTIIFIEIFYIICFAKRICKLQLWLNRVQFFFSLLVINVFFNTSNFKFYYLLSKILV